MPRATVAVHEKGTEFRRPGERKRRGVALTRAPGLVLYWRLTHLPGLSRGIHIRRIALVFLLVVTLPYMAVFSESPPAAGSEKLDMAGVLFGELTDNVDRPFATLPLFSVGGARLELHI